MLVAAKAAEQVRAPTERVIEVEALDAAGGALPYPILHPHHDGGPVEALHHPGGHDADDARVPALGIEDEAARMLGPLLGLGQGVMEDVALDGLPLGVGAVQHLGQGARGVHGLGAQQLQAQGRVMQPAGGVDAGPEPEAHLPGGDGAIRLHPRHLLERPHARAASRRELLQPVLDEDAVGAGEGHHVRHGGHGHQVHQRLEVGLLAGGEEAIVPQPLAQAHAEVEGHPRGAQVLGGVLATGLVRVEHGHGGRQRGRHRVVVHHHHVQPQLLGPGNLRHGGDAAVQRHQQPGALHRDARPGG